MVEQLVITVEDSSILPSLHKLLSSFRGISIMRRMRKTPYEQSLEDIEKGRINRYDSKEDFYKKMGI